MSITNPKEDHIPLSTIFPIPGSTNSSASGPESEQIQNLIDRLRLRPHVEGGYFVETDRDRHRVPNPFRSVTHSSSSLATGVKIEGLTAPAPIDEDDSSRAASTTIFYLLTPNSPRGAFHRNRARTVHTLHRGRGVYVIVHADEVADPSCPGGYGEGGEGEAGRWTAKARVEAFRVGPDVLAGERLQWIVEGGKYKCSFLLPDDEDAGETSGGLLISETVVPGFEYADHDFMTGERFEALIEDGEKDGMRWMLRRD